MIRTNDILEIAHRRIGTKTRGLSCCQVDSHPRGCVGEIDDIRPTDATIQCIRARAGVEQIVTATAKYRIIAGRAVDRIAVVGANIGSDT